MTPYLLVLTSYVLYFTIFLKGQERTEINTKSSQNAYEMYKLVNFWNLMKKTGKITNLGKKMTFGQTYMTFEVAMEGGVASPPPPPPRPDTSEGLKRKIKKQLKSKTSFRFFCIRDTDYSHKLLYPYWQIANFH